MVPQKQGQLLDQHKGCWSSTYSCCMVTRDRTAKCEPVSSYIYVFTECETDILVNRDVYRTIAGCCTGNSRSGVNDRNVSIGCQSQVIYRQAVVRAVGIKIFPADPEGCAGWNIKPGDAAAQSSSELRDVSIFCTNCPSRDRRYKIQSIKVRPCSG